MIPSAGMISQPNTFTIEDEDFAGSKYEPLLTSRAAALCDLGRWEDANRQIRRVIAISNDPEQEEAHNVLKRIQQNAPELFD
jgi:hypothetical protein